MLRTSICDRRTRARAAFSLIEIVMVIGIIAIITSIAVPRIDYMRYRMDAAAREVRTTLQKAQRLGVQRQYNIVVSFDQTANSIRVLEDVDNSGGQTSGSEMVYWYPLPEGTQFRSPPSYISLTGTGPIIGPDLSTDEAGRISVVFRRDGSASSDVEVFVGTQDDKASNYRGVQVTKSTGRTDWYRYIAGAWKSAGL